MAFDHDPGTRYANDTVGTNVTFDFGEVKTFAKLGLYFWMYEERSTSFTVEISADGTNFTQVYDGATTKGTKVNVLDINADARYIRLTNKGNDSDRANWFNLLEIVGYAPGTAVATTLN